jgi:hypothetical protein
VSTEEKEEAGSEDQAKEALNRDLKEVREWRLLQIPWGG